MKTKSMRLQLVQAKRELESVQFQCNNLASINCAHREREAKQIAEAMALPFRTLIVTLQDASGKTISMSHVALNKGDEASATVSHLGDIILNTSNAAR